MAAYSVERSAIKDLIFKFCHRYSISLNESEEIMVISLKDNLLLEKSGN